MAMSSSTAVEAGPVILPYTGGPTWSGASSSLLSKVGRQEQIEGRVEGFPAAPAGAFVVAGRTVTTDISTSFVRGNNAGSFSDLAVGQRVHVTGQSAAGNLAASLVKIENTQTSLPVNLNGIALGVSGGAAAFTFAVDSRDVRGDNATEFFGGSVFADLGEGVRVNVKGLQRDGFVYAQRIHVAAAREDDGDATSGGVTDPQTDGEPEPEPEPPAPVPPPPPPDPPAPVPPTPVPAFNPDPIQGLGQCQSWTCGFLFTPRENISVQALGQWDENSDGLGANAPVGVWSSDGTLLASVVVPIGTAAPLSNGYRFVAIAPIELVAGRQYVIASAFAGGGAPTFGAGGINPALGSPEGRVTLRGSGVLAFPASVNANLYGGGNFLFVPAAH
jgi:hypothetical protein